jgi:DNA-3-methyladenine glycosylase II
MSDLSPFKERVSPSARLQQAVAEVCQRDRDFLKIEQQAGPLCVYQWPATFESLVKIILGQQLSAKAAFAIFQRLNQYLELTPKHLLACPDSTLQQVGLSRTKIATCKGLAAALLGDRLNLEQLALASNEQVIHQLTQIKGIGPWTANLYLLFCLERLNSFPASDLAIQVSYQWLKGLPRRPTSVELLEACTTLSPYQGGAAHLLWHYYRYQRQQ